jgi:hypothetical protein
MPLTINVMTEKLRQVLRYRRWAEKYPDRKKTFQAAWRSTHSDGKKIYDAAWRQKNVKHRRAYDIAWAAANPERAREIGRGRSRRRRAHQRGRVTHFTSQEFLELKHQFGDRCVCCKRYETELILSGLMLVPDHVVPLAIGGSDDIENIQPLCQGLGGCNQRKGAKFENYTVYIGGENEQDKS